jgi:hypothetical protein
MCKYLVKLASAASLETLVGPESEDMMKTAFAMQF